jgi:hypothetical protein
MSATLEINLIFFFRVDHWTLFIGDIWKFWWVKLTLRVYSWLCSHTSLNTFHSEMRLGKGILCTCFIWVLQVLQGDFVMLYLSPVPALFCFSLQSIFFQRNFDSDDWGLGSIWAWGPPLPEWSQQFLRWFGIFASKFV